MKIKNKTNIFFMLGIMAVTRPGFLVEKIPFFSSFIRLYFFVCYAVLIIIVLSRWGNSDFFRYGKIATPIVLYGFLFFNTLLNHGELSISMFRLIDYSYCLLLCTVCFKFDAGRFLLVLRNVLFILIIINTLSVLVFPAGMYTMEKMTHELDYRYWFLGFKNGIGKYSIVLVTVSCMIEQLNKRKSDRIITRMSLFCSIISSVLIESASGVIGALLPFCIMMILSMGGKSKISQFVRMRNYFIIITFVFVTVVTSTKLLENETVVYVITNVFHKTPDLSGRLPIWQNVMKIISRNFIMGVGVHSGLYNARLIGGTANTVDAHNYYLEFLLEGGIIAFIILVIMLLQITYKLDKYRKIREIGILAGGVFTFLIILITENCNNYYLWLFLGICLNIDYYIEQKNDPIRIICRKLQIGEIKI